MNDYKVEDVVYPQIGQWKYIRGVVTEVEDRVNGCITVKFDDGQEGLYFRNELRHEVL